MVWMCSVEITVIDGEGKRHVIPGLEGQTVAQLLEQHTDILGPHGRSNSFMMRMRKHL